MNIFETNYIHLYRLGSFLDKYDRNSKGRIEFLAIIERDIANPSFSGKSLDFSCASIINIYMIEKYSRNLLWYFGEAHSMGKYFQGYM